MSMTATKPLEMPLSFALKQEKEENLSENDESDDDNESTDSDSVSSLPQPSILDKNSLNNIDPSNEFLRLTSMVRRVYFSYLHKSIINNYNVCCKTTGVRDVSRMDIKKFASQMELHAVRASLEASLYRQSMLKMISDVKSSTLKDKVDKKLSIFLQTPPSTVDAAVQTSEDLFTPDSKGFDERVDEVKDQPKVEIIPVKSVERVDEVKEGPKVEILPVKSLDDRLSQIFLPPVDDDQGDESCGERGVKREPMEIGKSEFGGEKGIEDDDKDVNIGVCQEDDSQDSLMQHLEDMFCESDDSSDLTSLIERHSGVTKTNVDREIRKMCPEALAVKSSESLNVGRGGDSSIVTPPMSQESSASGTKRKLTLSSYKSKKRALEGGEEDKETKKMRGIWLVERIHQVSKLKAKLMELSVRNYRKHGRIRSRFCELFGDDDGEDLAPDSPVLIEDHLTSCKERIAPWVVKYLMPFYSKKVIKDRGLFKAVAKHISDMLIIDNTFPEEEYVNQYIKDYFRNKPRIKTQADIYM